MSELVVIVYPDEQRATEALSTIQALKDEGALDLDDAVAVIKDQDGRIKIDGATSSTGRGAVGGLVLGTLIGAIFLAPVVGALFGAAGGALAGSFADVGRIDDFSARVASNMPPGSSALLMLATATNPDRTLTQLGRYGGTVMRTTLPDDAAARLRAALDQPAGAA